MGSIWEFIDKHGHFGAKGSARRDFLYGLDTDVVRNTDRLKVYLKIPPAHDAKRHELTKESFFGRSSPSRKPKNLETELKLETELTNDLKDLETRTTIDPLHAFLSSEVPLGRANRFDRFIWDLYLRTKTKHFQVLTLFTNDIQATYFLLWKHSPFRLDQCFCSFFEVRSNKIRERDEHFMLKAGALADPAALFGTKKRNAENKIRRAREKDLSTLLYWNQFSVDPDPPPSSPTSMRFKRRFLMLEHPCRKYFQNVALLTEALDRSDINKLRLAFEKTADFYTCLRHRAEIT